MGRRAAHPGKHYVARADNIRRYTNQRFEADGLDEAPESLDEPMPPKEVPLTKPDAAPGGEAALLLHLDDLHPESLPLAGTRIVRVGGLVAHAPGASERVRQADEAAMADGLARAAAHFGCEAMPATGDWAGGLPIVTAWAPVGPSAEALPDGCLRVRRAWDEATWPVSRRGFFKVRQAIPAILADLG